MFQNIVSVLSGRVLSLLLSAASSVLLARYLGSLELGRYAALYAYLTLFVWLGTLGLDQILTREAARHRAEAASILMTGALLGLVFCGVTSVLALLFAPAVGYTGQLRWLLVLAAVDLLILTPIKYPALVFQVDLRQWYGVSIGLFRQLTWLGVIIVCALWKASLTWVIAGRLFCSVIEAVLILAVSFRFFLGPWRFLSGQVRTLLAHSAPLAFTVLAVNVYHRIDQVLLHTLVSDQELGYYVSAVNLTEVFSALPVAVMASLFPILSQFHKDEDRFQRYVGFSFRYLVTAAFGLCLLVTLMAHEVIYILYGPALQSATSMLAVLIWSEGAVFFSVVMNTALIAGNLQKLTLVPSISGAAINVGLNLVMIPLWGGLGVAWATSISYTFAGVFAYLLFPSARPITRLGLRTFLISAALAAVLVGALLPLGLHVIVKLLLGALAYLSGIWFMGLLNREDLDRAWAITGKRVLSMRSGAG